MGACCRRRRRRRQPGSKLACVCWLGCPAPAASAARGCRALGPGCHHRCRRCCRRRRRRVPAGSVALPAGAGRGGAAAGAPAAAGAAAGVPGGPGTLRAAAGRRARGAAAGAGGAQPGAVEGVRPDTGGAGAAAGEGLGQQLRWPAPLPRLLTRSSRAAAEQPRPHQAGPRHRHTRHAPPAPPAQEAAGLFEKAGMLEKAAGIHIAARNFAAAAPLMAQISSPQLQRQYARAKEGEGRWAEPPPPTRGHRLGSDRAPASRGLPLPPSTTGSPCPPRRHYWHGWC